MTEREPWVCRKCGASNAPHRDYCECSPPQIPLGLDRGTPLPFPNRSIYRDRGTPAVGWGASNVAPTADRGKVLELLDPKPSPKAKVRNDYPNPEFGRFWEVYPLKVGKAAAYRMWMRRVIDAGVEPQTVIDGALRYRNDPTRDPAKTKYPEGWLNDARWLDQPAEAPPSAEIAATDWDAVRAEEDARIDAIRAEDTA